MVNPKPQRQNGPHAPTVRCLQNFRHVLCNQLSPPRSEIQMCGQIPSCHNQLITCYKESFLNNETQSTYYVVAYSTKGKGFTAARV